MFCTTITRRLAGTLATLGAAAAFAAPVAFAGGHHGYGPPDPWSLRYVNAGSAAFATDTTDSARVARLQGTGALAAGFATDTVNSARVERTTLAGSLPAGFQTDTVNSARLRPVVEQITVSGGFDWSSFGIGIGSGIGAIVALGVLASRTGRLRRLASA